MNNEIIERRGKAQNKEESQQLEFWKNKYDKLKPMNADGYFNIEKSTLTSMLSVRYFKAIIKRSILCFITLSVSLTLSSLFNFK